MDETTTPAQRATEVLAPAGKLFDLVDALKQEYTIQREAAQTQEAEGRRTNARIHYGKAATLANLLGLYYQAQGATQEAENWTIRAVRFHQRTFNRENRIATNIGARDHDR